MNILKSLKPIFPFKRSGSKKLSKENEYMAQERFASHLAASLKGHTSRFNRGPFKPGSPKMDHRLAQSKMDRTRHALFLAKLKLASIS